MQEKHSLNIEKAFRRNVIQNSLKIIKGKGLSEDIKLYIR